MTKLPPGRRGGGVTIISTPGDEMERREKNGRTRLQTPDSSSICARKVGSASDRPEHADQAQAGPSRPPHAAKSCPFGLFATPERTMAGSGCAGWSAFQYHSETGERGDPCLFLTDKQRPRGRPAVQRALLRNDGHGAWQHGSIVPWQQASSRWIICHLSSVFPANALQRYCCDTATILLKC